MNPRCTADRVKHAGTMFCQSLPSRAESAIPPPVPADIYEHKKTSGGAGRYGMVLAPVETGMVDGEGRRGGYELYF